MLGLQEYAVSVVGRKNFARQAPPKRLPCKDLWSNSVAANEKFHNLKRQYYGLRRLRPVKLKLQRGKL